MEISDYIPQYPEITNPKFNDEILHKKEFYDLKTGSESNQFGEPGDLWTHQQLIARFLSPNTPYNTQLLYHTPGTGKTCAASAITEINKLDPLVRKPVIIIVPNDTLVNQWKQQIAMVCTDGEYIPDNFFSQDPLLKLTDAEKTTRINKLIRPVYHITTMERMRREIDKFKGAGSDVILRNRYSNTIIIIDEAHNLRIQSNTSKKNIEASKGRYKSFHRFLHAITNSKIILLSGTPMYDRISELPGLLNLLLPIDQQLPTGADFSRKFLKKEDEIRSLRNKVELMNKMVGRVSYIREGGNFPERIDIGDADWIKYIKVSEAEMSKTQLAGYRQAFAQDNNKESSMTTGLWKNSRQAATFVFKDGDKYLWGNPGIQLLTTKLRPKKVEIKGRTVTLTNIALKAGYKEKIRNNLQEYSAKFNVIIEFLEKNPTTPTFIFTPLVSGTGGAIFLGLILQLFGYVKAVGNETTPGKRYALITGDDKSSLQRKTLIDMYNSPQNINGELIQVMIATKTISEGTSFTNVKHEFILSPYWNNSGTEQAIGRGLRANSLASLPNEERKVRVQQLAAVSDKLKNSENIDIHMYKMSEAKDYEIKDAERLLKRVAWDCTLNYQRNVRKMDKDNTRACDYQKCNYVCYQTKPNRVGKVWNYDVPEKDLKQDTFLLFYSKKEMLEVVEKIKDKLKRYSFINLQGLDDLLSVDNFKLFVLAVEYIIENHVTVYNQWGQPCFLRKQGNMLFLADSPTETKALGSWYASYPFANDLRPLGEIINNKILANDLQKLDGLDPKNKIETKRVISQMNLESKIFVLEYLLSIENEEMDNRQRGLYDAFINAFEDHIFRVGDEVLHDLEKIKITADYIDFETGDDGSLRCLSGGVWNYCQDEEQYSIAINSLKKNTTNIDVIENEFGIYGIITSDGKFQLADKTKETGNTDRRGLYRGKVCTSWKKPELVEIFLRVGVEPNKVDKTLTKKKELMDRIKELKLDAVVPKNATIATLQIIHTLGKQTVRDLCNQLQVWFQDNELIAN